MRPSTALLGRATNCVHICDREGDIYELFCAALELGTRFLVRTSADRRAGGGDHTIADEMTEEAIEKLHWYALRWRIETLHKILESGGRTGEAKLRTAERLVNLVWRGLSKIADIDYSATLRLPRELVGD